MGATIKIRFDLVIFIALGILVVACNNQDVVGSVVTSAPIDTVTSQPPTNTKDISATPPAIATYTPTPTLANTSEPIKTPEPIFPPKNIETSTPTPTNTPLPPPTPLPTLLPSPTPGLPQAVPSPASVAGIGTAVPSAAGIITAENVTALTEVAQWGKGEIVDAEYSPDGTVIYALTELGLYLYDADTAQQLEFRPYNYEPRTMALSTDGKTIAVVTRPNYIELRDAISNSFITSFSPFPNTDIYIRQIDFDRSGAFLFITTFNQVHVWDIAHATSVAEMSDLDNDSLYTPTTFAISSPSDLIAMVIDGNNVIHLWQWQDKKLILTAELEIPESLDDDLYGLAISPDGNYVALGDLYLSIAVWQVKDKQLLYILNERQSNRQSKRLTTRPMLSGPGRYVIAELQFSPDNKLLAETTGFQHLTLWQVSDGQSVQELAQVGHGILFAPDNKIISIWNHSLSQWDIENGNFINTLKQHIGSITDLALMPNQGQLAIASWDSYIYLRQLHDGRLATSLRTPIDFNDFHAQHARAIDITSDGNTLVAATDKSYSIWDLINHQMINLEPDPDSGWGAVNMIISFDGQYVIGKGGEFSPPSYPLILWETDKKNEFEYMSFYAPTDMTFSPTDLLLATTTLDGEQLGLILLQPNTGISQDLLLDLNVDNPSFYSTIVFAPNGRFLVISTGDNRILIWEINNQKAEFLRIIDTPYTPHQVEDIAGSVEGIAITPDNKLIAINSINTVTLLDMNDGRILHTFSPSTAITDILFSADGRYLIIGDGYGTVRLWAVP